MPMDIFRARLGFTPYSPAYENVFMDWKQTFDKALVGDLTLTNCMPGAQRKSYDNRSSGADLSRAGAD